MDSSGLLLAWRDREKEEEEAEEVEEEEEEEEEEDEEEGWTGLVHRCSIAVVANTHTEKHIRLRSVAITT